MSKTCTKCRKELSLACFTKANGYKDGIKSRCKSCIADYSKKRKEKNWEKMYDKQKEWKAANKEHVKGMARKYYYRDQESQIIRMRKWRNENSEKMIAATVRWQKNNPLKVAMTNIRRRKHIIQRTPSYANQLAIEIFYWVSRQLTKTLQTEYQVDHIIPLRGKLISGFHHENNLQVLTKSANCRKSNLFTI